MVRKNGFRSRRTRRTTRRVPARRRRKAYPGRYMPGFPATRIVKLRYVQRVTLNPGIGSKALYQFRANSMFDPDLSGVGHQPLGFDQLVTPFWNHYTVLSSSIKCDFLYTSGNSNTGALIGVYLADDNAIPLTGEEIAEQGLGKYKVIPSVNYAAIGGKTPSIRNSFSAKKFFNVSDVKDNINRIGSQVNDNPTEGAVFNVWAESMTPTTDLGAYEVLVTMNFTATLSEPKSLAQS